MFEEFDSAMKKANSKLFRRGSSSSVNSESSSVSGSVVTNKSPKPIKEKKTQIKRVKTAELNKLSFKETPYNCEGRINYLILVNSMGKFVRCLTPQDFCNMKPVENTLIAHSAIRPWMRSVVFSEVPNSTVVYPLFPVMVDGNGFIIDGVYK